MGFSHLVNNVITKRLLSPKPHASSWALTATARSLYHGCVNDSDNNGKINAAFGDNDHMKISKSSYHVNSGGFMRGAVFWEPNKPLTIEEFQMPRPKAGEVLIKTKGNYLYISMDG